MMEEFRSITDMLNDGEYVEDTDAFGIGTETCNAMESPIANNTPSSKSKATQNQKGKNINVDEDKLLVSAWLNVSTDGTQGTNQTKAAFWTRVYRYYHNHRDDLAERSHSSLLHRWGCIQEAVSKFCGYISQIEAANQSGLNIHDRVWKLSNAVYRFSSTFSLGLI